MSFEPDTISDPEADAAAALLLDTPDVSPDETDAWRRELEAASDPNDLLERIARTVPREDLLRNPLLAGIVGDAADKLERRRSAEREREAELASQNALTAEQQRRLDEAADDDDLLTLGEHAKEQVLEGRRLRQELAARTERETAAAQLFATHAMGSLDAYVDTLPSGLRERVVAMGQAKAAELNKLGYREGFQAWLGDMVTTTVEHARADWEKTTRASIRREVLGEIESGEGADSPEFGNSGGAVAGGLISQTEWDANRTNPTWRRTNLERLKRSIVAGTIRE